ncbi:hypothetical protein [Aquibacillus salsiterrae]|uniref:Uncharacterized protein n=1 Tax=Aquibacillus salsiterrae TaxID=2950439 RepID=A0A9X3WDZ0_9BACI|nr:hypothetical protein [Aquibacillus salsiterrae]MDC3418097.1 hypothetical protein [Aquibacillus salsiterrae]
MQKTIVNQINNSTTGKLDDENNEEINQNTEVVDSNITNEDFLQAVKQLKPDFQLSDSIIGELKLQQLKVNQGFYIVWTEYST